VVSSGRPMKITKRILQYIGKQQKRLTERWGQLQPQVIVPKHKGTEFEVNKWALSRFVLDTLVPIVGTEPYPLDELMLMTGVCALYKPTHIFEWGTNVGKSARVFYETVKYCRLDTVIYSIDLPEDAPHPEHPHRKRGQFVKDLDRVALKVGDGVNVATEIAATLGAAARSMFFVDGDHEYASVSRELGVILNMCPNAPVLIHDTFYQSSEANYNTGPYRAIEDILEADRFKHLKTLTLNMGLPGMTLLYNTFV